MDVREWCVEHSVAAAAMVVAQLVQQLAVKTGVVGAAAVTVVIDTYFAPGS